MALSYSGERDVLLLSAEAPRRSKKAAEDTVIGDIAARRRRALEAEEEARRLSIFGWKVRIEDIGRSDGQKLCVCLLRFDCLDQTQRK